MLFTCNIPVTVVDVLLCYKEALIIVLELLPRCLFN